MPEDDVFPDRDMSHRDKVVFMLEREGWALDAVPTRTDLDPPFPRYAYTIGLEDRFGFPELCVVGLSPVACRGLFDLVVDAVAGGTELPIGAAFIGLLDGGQPCALLPVDPAACASLFPSLTQHHTLAGQPPGRVLDGAARLARRPRRPPLGAGLRRPTSSSSSSSSPSRRRPDEAVRCSACASGA